MIDVTNGDVLAMASHPTYSPNVFVGGISNDDWNTLSSESSHNPLLNRAIAGQYPSASTIKPLTTFAALNFGIATTDSSYYCSGYWTGFGRASGQYCWKKTAPQPPTPSAPSNSTSPTPTPNSWSSTPWPTTTTTNNSPPDSDSSASKNAPAP